MEVFVRWLIGLGVLASTTAHPLDRVRVATYNLENYILESTPTRARKADASRTRIGEIIRDLRADVLGLQEIGGAAALAELRSRLARLGLNYPFAELVSGADTNIQVALLSRFPIVARRPHTNDAFLLASRRFRVSRGFVEADIQLEGPAKLTVFVAHLKSRRTMAEADEAEVRREEARVLREKIDRCRRENPRARIVVLGDLNDTRDSEAVRLLVGRGRSALVDTRPAEANGDSGHSPNPRWPPRSITWTHYYGVEDTYARIDYILLDSNAAATWRPEESRIVAAPDWGLASDHRPLVVTLRVGGGG